jgi:hypothetical protein
MIKNELKKSVRFRTLNVRFRTFCEKMLVILKKNHTFVPVIFSKFVYLNK